VFRRLCELFLKGAVEDYRRAAIYPPPVARQKETVQETKRESPREPGAAVLLPINRAETSPGITYIVGGRKMFQREWPFSSIFPAPLNSCYAIAL